MADFQGKWQGATVADPNKVTVILDADSADSGEITLADIAGNPKIVLTARKDADGAAVASDAADKSAVYGANRSLQGFGVTGENTTSGARGFLAGQTRVPITDQTIQVGVGGECDQGELGVGVFGTGVSAGVQGYSQSKGLLGQSEGGFGVFGNSTTGDGVQGLTQLGHGVSGVSTDGHGVSGSSTKGHGVFGTSGEGHGVFGTAVDGRVYMGKVSGPGVSGSSKSGDGVRGETQSTDSVRAAVYGNSSNQARGVLGSSLDGFGTSGSSKNGSGVFGWSENGDAGEFSGRLDVTGNIYGAEKNFRIDHPLEPTTKYLIHSCVESSERLNLYSGGATLDANGEVWIDLPHWFGALNTRFRYQLTAVVGSAELHIAQK
jgi:hypothetical protein